MPSFNPQNSGLPTQEVLQLRAQGLTDNLIVSELQKKGYSMPAISQAIAQSDSGDDFMGGMGNEFPSAPPIQRASSGGYPMPPPLPATNNPDNLYERMEEVAESLIDEKWDELIAEVKKIVEWKEKIEEKQSMMNNELDKLKEDFKILHQGVLGKLDDYDQRMQDVGTELKAVGKVFKDVVPDFVDNVKELKGITQGMKR